MDSGNQNKSRGWHVAQGDNHFGPYEADVLSDWIATGRISPGAMLSDGGPWISIAEFMRRQAAQPRAAPPPLPPLPMPTSSPGPEAPSFNHPTDGPAPFNQPAVANAVAQAPAMSTAPAAEDDDAPPERDRIVIIGRRQSGKTIYLASVYAKLWQSLNGLTAKALSGDVHKQLMTAHHALRRGEWPAATLGTSRMELELEFAGKKRLTVTLDYAGELFRKAFLEEEADFPGVKELVGHIDRALSVVLLVDPSVVAGMDHDAAMDDDFGLVQAVQRIRNWPGGDEVPVVLVLTKMDQHQGLIDRFGSAKEFVRKHFPALVRLLKQIPIFQVSAVQVEVGPDGKRRPRPDSHPINIDAPLRFCLTTIDKASEKLQRDRHEEERRTLEMRLERDARAKEQRQNRLLAVTVISIVVFGAAVAVWILSRAG